MTSGPTREVLDHTAGRAAVHAVAVGGVAWTRTPLEAHDQRSRGHGATASRAARGGLVARAVSRRSGRDAPRSPQHAHRACCSASVNRSCSTASTTLARARAVLRLTGAGRRTNAQKAGTVEYAIAEALNGVSAHDRAAARRVLERLAAHLDPDDPEAKPPRATSSKGQVRR